MLPDRVSNPGPLTYESGALPIALRGTARKKGYASYWTGVMTLTDLKKKTSVLIIRLCWNLFGTWPSTKDRWRSKRKIMCQSCQELWLLIDMKNAFFCFRSIICLNHWISLKAIWPLTFNKIRVEFERKERFIWTGVIAPDRSENLKIQCPKYLKERLMIFHKQQ